MKRKPFVIFLLVLFSSIAFSQTKEKESKIKQEFTICNITFTEAGKTVHHQYSYDYLINSDQNGKVDKITTLHKTRPKLVNEEDFIPCIKSWKFNPSSRIFVKIFYGTTSSNFSISILDIDKKEAVKIPLPIDSDVSQINKDNDFKKAITLCSIKLKNLTGNFNCSLSFAILIFLTNIYLIFVFYFLFVIVFK